MQAISIFNALKKKANEDNVKIGRVSEVPQNDLQIYPNTYRTTNFLQTLSTETNKFKAIELLIENVPDAKMAVNAYLRLANQGINFEVYNTNSGQRTKRYDKEIRELCTRLAKNIGTGVDGLLDQLHYSAIVRGGIACEVLVNKDADDIEDVVMIDPATISEFKWLKDKNRYAIYQQQSNGQKVDLYDGNFVWVPHQPKVGRPDGTLQFETAIMNTQMFYSLFENVLKVLEKVILPKLKFTIDIEAFRNGLPPAQQNDFEKIRKALEGHFEDVKRYAQGIKAGSDFIGTNDTEVSVIGGGNFGSFGDMRALFEPFDPLIVNSYQLTPVLLGRLKGGSYSLSSIELKIVTDTINSARRPSKRVCEYIMNTWARVKGYAITIKAVHNPIELEEEIKKLDVMLKRAELNRRAEEYNWISHDAAAIDAMNVEKADSSANAKMYEYLKNITETTATETATETTDKTNTETSTNTSIETTKQTGGTKKDGNYNTTIKQDKTQTNK